MPMHSLLLWIFQIFIAVVMIAITNFLQQHSLHTTYSTNRVCTKTLFRTVMPLLSNCGRNIMSRTLQRIPLTLNIHLAMVVYIAAALASALQIIHTSSSTTTDFYIRKVNISVTSTIATTSNATTKYSEAIFLFDNCSKAHCLDTNESFALNGELLNTTANATAYTISSSYPLESYKGLYDVSYIAKTNPFWLQFEPPSDELFFIMGLIYCIISSVGAAGNTLVIFMFVRCKSLRTPANKLVINLAISDLIMLLKCPIAAYNNFKRGPALGELACRIYGFLGGLSGTASIGTLTAIALDRYNVVVHPLDPLRYTSKLRTHIIIMIIWCYSCLFSIIPALDVGLSIYVPEGLWFVAWTPYSIVAMLGVFGQEQYLTPIGSMIPALFCKTAACIDPYVYAATHPRFRMEFRRLIYGKNRIKRSSTIRSSILTRSSTARRLRTNSDACNRTNDMPESINNLNLSVVPELKEGNNDYVKVVHPDAAKHMEQSQF
uniref:G-protein coupled receptors family 1 profile domain-containing protein n=1 Tax=Glossina pallidipes TaxID=7398 RepID=A0A1B0A754_GLOPL